MKADLSVKILLLVIAVSLSVIAWRPFVSPPPVAAGAGEVGEFYVEPGVSMLRAPDRTQQVLGKVVIDLRNGNIWGFPTLSQDPYPASGATSGPPTSHGFLLGRFAFSDMDK